MKISLNCVRCSEILKLLFLLTVLILLLHLYFLIFEGMIINNYPCICLESQLILLIFFLSVYLLLFS